MRKMTEDTLVSFTQMKDGTKEEYLMLHELEKPFHEGTADRLLRELARQGEETLAGYRITRLQHGLQSATRARRDGADIDWVVATLLHDIGDGLAPQNHDRFAAEIMRPFMREEVTWVVEHHGVDFCERWDQSSFDPDYPMDPLESFADEVREVFGRKAYDEAVIREGVVVGLP
jgi:predicted HD phosphohydrolase